MFSVSPGVSLGPPLLLLGFIFNPFPLLSCSPPQRSIEDLLSRQAEVNERIQMSEDDVAQVNDLLSVVQESKEARTSCSASQTRRN